MGLAFNDATTGLGLCQETDSICKTNSTSYPLLDKARRANIAMSDFAGIVLSSDDRWQFDDTNYTNLPIGLTTITSGQNDYSFASDVLKILKIEVKDSNGDWTELQPIDRDDTSIPYDELFTTGVPQYYDKFANSVLLYPTPDYTQASSLRVWFQRDASTFASTDTTKTPGIPSIFHKYIALKMAEPYLRDNKKENYVSIRNEIQKYEEEKIPEFYAKRDKDEVPMMKARVMNCQ